MYKISQAIYQNGHLILSEKLSPEMEGKNLKIIILGTDSVTAQRDNFFRLVDKHAFTLSENYKFDREDLYAR